MKAEELMIGDWVLVNGKPQQVTEILHKGINPTYYGMSDEIETYVKENDIEPILITPEILEKNGLWEKDPDRNPNCLIAEANTTKFNDTDGKPHSWLEIQDLSSIECMRWYIKIWGKGNLGMSGYVGYIHELQHALKLCGIKTEILV